MKKTHSLSILLSAMASLALLISLPAAAQTPQSPRFITDQTSCPEHEFTEMSVNISGFPADHTVRSARDVKSVCINVEHSSVRDVYIVLYCPDDSMAMLKYGHGHLFDNPGGPGSDAGVERKLGMPLDGEYDDISHACDSTRNPYGHGLDYCFSRRNGYRLVGGEWAGQVWDADTPHPEGDYYMASQANVTFVTTEYDTIPEGFAKAGTKPTDKQMPTTTPSDRAARTDYYLPYADYSSLVGCHMNGTWRVRLYDGVKLDNGWLFDFSIELAAVDDTVDNDTLGIGLPMEVGFGLHPNPAAGSVTVDLPQPMDGGLLTLMDMQGRTLKHLEAKSGEEHMALQLDGVPAGAYLLQLVTPQGVAVRKLIVR